MLLKLCAACVVLVLQVDGFDSEKIVDRSGVVYRSVVRRIGRKVMQQAIDPGGGQSELDGDDPTSIYELDDVMGQNFIHIDDLTVQNAPSFVNQRRAMAARFSTPNLPNPNFPRPVQNDQACLAAARSGLPVMVYLALRGKYFSMWEAQYYQDILANCSASMVLCELTEWKETLPKILRHSRSTHSATGLILDSNGLGLPGLATFLKEAGAEQVLKVLIHAADELGSNPPKAYYGSLVAPDGTIFRQYHYSKEKYPLDPIPRVRTIPLGYAADMPLSADACAASRKLQFDSKEYDWAFSGSLSYGNRQEMIEILSMRFKNHLQKSMGASQMAALYSKSVFVPVGRGHSTLDCFRIYEALIMGAIPVIVGPSSEIQDTFGDHRDLPAVFAASWTAAADQMAQLLHEPSRLHALQHRISGWFCGWFGDIRSEIASSLN